MGVPYMKNYLKKNLWLPIICVWAVIVAVGAAFLNSPFRGIFIAVFTAAAAAAIIFIFLNKYCVKVFKALAPTSYFSDLRFRNMDAIAVGSTIAWKYLNIDEEKCYDAVGIRRSNAMCFNMLKTYFSHVHTNGTVYYFVDPLESDAIGDYASPCDFIHIHRLVFLYLGMSSPMKRRENPMIYDTDFSLRCAAAYFCKKHSLLPKTWKLSASHAVEISEDLRGQLAEVRSFCEERELCLKLVVINRSTENNEKTAAKVRKSLGWKNDISVSAVSCSDELNSVLMN